MEASSQNKPCCTWKPTTAGILTIVAGAINVITGIVVLVWRRFGMMGGWYGFGGHMGFGITRGTGAVLIVIGIISVIGGAFALRRRLWGLSLAGAILALFPPRVIVLGILSIIFLALSKGEFDQSGSRSNTAASLNK
jgi:hypothetical protein